MTAEDKNVVITRQILSQTFIFVIRDGAPQRRVHLLGQRYPLLPIMMIDMIAYDG